MANVQLLSHVPSCTVQLSLRKKTHPILQTRNEAIVVKLDIRLDYNYILFCYNQYVAFVMLEDNVML